MKHLRSALRGACGLALICLLPGSAAFAQASSQFGGQERADAAAKMIVLAVQQAISSLPPASGQSFAYTYDPELSTYVASERLGPTALRSTQTIGKGKASARFSTSYFELSKSFGPLTYFNQSQDQGFADGYARLSLEAKAKVTLFNLAFTYGITDGIEVMLNLPVVSVDASAKQSFTSRAATFDGVPPDATCPPSLCTDRPAELAPWSGAETEEALDAALRLPTTLGGGNRNPAAIRYRSESFDNLGFDFNGGTQGGIGRVNLGAKALLLTSKWLQVAFAPELTLPSPSEDELAGSASRSLMGRVILQGAPVEMLSLHADLGYEHDFDEVTLRRFVWNCGASMPFERFAVDLGFGGSEFTDEIEWTPETVIGRRQLNDDGSVRVPQIVGTRQQDAGIGASFVDVVAGFKFRLLEKTVLGASLSAPLNDDGLRPDVVGTVALEQYF